MMNKYWKDHPPLHVLVAAFVGYEKKADPAKTPQDIKALLGRFGVKQES